MIPDRFPPRAASARRCAALLAVLVFAGVARGDIDEMIEVSDLRETARIVDARNLVLVLEFSSDYCEYCRRLEEAFLLPMQRNGDYDGKVLIRAISLDPHETVIDFDGRLLDTKDFAARYGVSLTPTLVFLNSEGVELSEKLVGIWSEDFYGAFIDERIERALEELD